MRQTLRDSHLTENGGPSVYRFLAVARRPPRPELVIYLGERPGPADAVLVWGRLAGVNYLSDRPRRGAIGFVRPLLDPPNTELRRQYGADGHSRVRFECQSRRPAARHPGQTL